jgi:predicted AAA+ superfamily ATPase
MKEIILAHKSERDLLLKGSYVLRQGIERARKSVRSDIIKVIIGPRRAGKSVFSLQMLQGEEFAYLNFDDERLYEIRDYDRIIKGINEVYGSVKYLLFDEIQNLTKWELFVNRLQRTGYNLVITGSNSRLLSRELATHLTGRFTQFNIYTFSFSEFIRARKVEFPEPLLKAEQGKILYSLSEYLTMGGYPEIIVKGLESKDYLRFLFDSIIFKDVVKRYNIRFSKSLYDLALFLISNYAREYSFTKLKNLVNFKSVHTVQNYVRYLEEAYLLFSLKRFSYKAREQLKAPAKMYVYDTGLASAIRLTLTPDYGRLIENVAAVELLRRQKDVYYYKDKTGAEVDFLIKEGLKVTELIQVCYDIADAKAKNRETKSLIKAGKELAVDRLSFITWDYENEELYDGRQITFVPLWKWLFSSLNQTD